MDELIRTYFTLGLQQSEIICCLGLNHNIFISERHLRRKLRELGLFRRRNFTDILTVCKFLEENITTHGQLHGYKWLHLKCLQNNLVVTQENIRILLHAIDPVGVDFRMRRRLRRRQYQNKGPNYLWHMDCYDKLKPFGICISGCIDGFSRKIIWLRAGSNSSDPRIIAVYYLESVIQLGGCPKTLRADMGTENGIVEEFQVFLRNQTQETATRNGLPHFLYGRSTTNQRIEAWWSILRKHHSQYWLNIFHQLKDDGLFDGSFLDKSLIQFCFLKMIQEELEVIVKEWNIHKISGSRNSVSPRGRPYVLYHMPQIYGTYDYICETTSENLRVLEDMLCISENDLSCDQDVYDLAIIILREKQKAIPKESFEAVDVYIMLRNEIKKIL